MTLSYVRLSRFVSAGGRWTDVAERPAGFLLQDRQPDEGDEIQDQELHRL